MKFFEECVVFICRPCNDHREQLCEILHSRRAQYVIITLVVVDMIIVIAELLIDLKAVEGRHLSIDDGVFIYFDFLFNAFGSKKIAF